MPNWLKLPALRVAALYLLLLAVVAVAVKMDLPYTISRLVGFIAISAGFLLIPLGKYKQGVLKYPFLTNNLITILIMFLVLDEFIPIWQLFIFGLIASLIKHFVRLNRLPVFNPAAAGVLVAVLFGALETWWGSSFAPRFTEVELSSAIILTIPFGLYLAYKYKKWAVSFSFLALYGILMTFWLHEVPVYQLLEGTMLFFAFIMVSEPKTSPNNVMQQVVFGSAVGIMSVVALMQGIPSPYAVALLIANAGFRLFMWWQQKQRMKMMPKPGTPPSAAPVQSAPVTSASSSPQV